MAVHRVLVEAAIADLHGGKPLAAVVQSLGIKEEAFRYRYRRITGEPLRMKRRTYANFTAPVERTIRAYMAGIIDGEGWISRNGSVEHNHPWVVAFASTDRNVIDFFAKHGGRVYTRLDSSLRCGTIKSVKRQWSWSLHRQRDIHRFLTTILPYMVIKREKATECLADVGGRIATQDHYVGGTTAKPIDLSPPVFAN